MIQPAVCFFCLETLKFKFKFFVKLEAEEKQLFFSLWDTIPSWDHSQMKITNLSWSWFCSSAAQVKPIIGQKKRIQTRLWVFSGCLLTWLPHGLDITRNDVGGAGAGFPRSVTLRHIPLMRVLKYVLSDGCAPEEALIDASWFFLFSSSQAAAAPGRFAIYGGMKTLDSTYSAT